MPLVEVKCKNCGAAIKIDENTKSGVCEFCRTPYVQEDLFVHTNIENSTVVINDETSIESRLKNGETNLTKFKNYTEAAKIYRYVTQAKTDDYRGWWGLVRALTQEFSLFDISETNYDEIRHYAENTLMLASDKNLDTISKDWKTYSEKVEKIISDKKKNAKSRKLATLSIGLVIEIILAIIIVSSNMFKNVNEIKYVILMLIAIFSNTALQTILGKIGKAYQHTYLALGGVLAGCAYFIYAVIHKMGNDFAVGIIVPILALVSLLIFMVCRAITVDFLAKYKNRKY